MTLIYIKDVRKTLHSINNCENKTCNVGFLCYPCQEKLNNLLEWAQDPEYYEQLRVSDTVVDSNVIPISLVEKLESSPEQPSPSPTEMPVQQGTAVYVNRDCKTDGEEE